ncbi:uncharacterized protein N7443_006544 [Penicillium atrosanguineum]|uniref:MoaB/Mog domain-containing protein n=1 Tax=Penicillium atrosanguineum TaxID=1132637 RepID=A0A9W9U5T3_9EURO|nr:uncharacterized protein N7443_006544 [Penicillium atrosanguineum]KAJ5298424.1 hypothetical protein N7443_006544 [Penicillium atrosanguineum]KAJ5321307.1 hypothetical protein N7476_004309 [Penicillium atrosanguineum]
MDRLKAAILIVSDTASQDPASDKTASALTPILTAEGKWESPAIKIVPDNVFHIQQAVCDWTDGPNWHNLILLSGGTGFAVRDITPEAVSPLIHRHAPGLVHGMIAASLKVTPFAMMSRPVAGVRDKTLIITLPGSPKGAVENLEAIVKLLPHACLQSAGANSRNMHAAGVKSLEAEAGFSSGSSVTQTQHNHHHHHHHGHGHGHVVVKAHTTPRSNDPAAGPGRRYRASPYPMLSVEKALCEISEHTPEPIVIEAPVNASTVGCVVAEDVYAAEAVPAYRASTVDGYAIIASEGANTSGTFPVASITHANVGGVLVPLQPGTVARITTGAPLPPNANAVVMVEDTELATTTPDGNEEATIQILAEDILPGENVREPGSDVALGSKILSRGDIISPIGGEIGLLAATGTQTVKVFKKPTVGVLSTGDELVEHDDPRPLTGGQIRDSNRPSLISCLQSWGFSTVDLGIARDTPVGELEHALRDSLRGVGRASSSVDVIVTTGGVSMGELDLLKPTIERSLGGTIHFGRVSMKPGKPTTFATIPFKAATSDSGALTQQERQSKLIFSLPGNPASALVTLNLFVLPSLHKLSGLGENSQALSTKPWMAPQLGLPRVAVVLTHHFPLDPKRTEYHRAVVTGSRSDGRLYATSTGIDGVGQRSSRVGSLAAANALVILRPGRGVGIKGEIMEALMMGPVHASDTRIIC